MRIQHNIAAMNSYRNYNNNVKSVNSNLEKLSSGYKVNRAGDDAAGLAISEKMRAQITGLDAAQKNVKDGISLVKTAEGAMQEIQDMLNRMDYLATQSANGTYDNEVDRLNLDKEVTALKSEINRIADSANFNGIKLLDGSLDANGSVSNSGTTTGLIQMTIEQGGAELTMKDVAATKGSYQNTALTAGQIKDGETLEITFTLNNGKTAKVSLTAKDYTDGTAGGELVGADGTRYGIYAAGGATGPDANELSKAMAAAIKESDLAGDFKVKDDTSGQFTLTNINAGADAPQILKDLNVRVLNADGSQKSETVNTLTVQTKGEDAYQTLDGDQIALYDGTDNSVLSVNGKKFAVLVQDGTDATEALMKKAKEAGLELIMVEDNDGADITNAGDGGLHLNAADANKADQADTNKQAAAAAQAKTIATVLSSALGMKVEWNASTLDDTNTNVKDKGRFSFKADTSINPGSTAGKALTLQIGDTPDQFNQMRVSIGDMHTDAMGTGKATLDGKTINVTKTISDISIANQEDAADAIYVIRNAINYVSGVRGDLGAIQNRLDHTANNLSVMEENIQDAESTIRDTDVAEEMMAYTKNNILVQSAQAMLAQANQIPQGVLQLLG